MLEGYDNEDGYAMSRWLTNIYEQAKAMHKLCNTKTDNNFVGIALFVALIVASPFVYEQVQFNNGNLLKVVEAYEAQPNEQGGFVKTFLVQDHEGNTYEVYTGFIAQWSKSEGDYINQKYLKSGGR